MTTTIPDPTPTPPTPPSGNASAPPVEPSPSLLAGKFATPEALAESYKALHAKMELPGDPPAFKSVEEAVAGYKKLESMFGRLNSAKPSDAPKSTTPTIPEPPKDAPPVPTEPAEIIKAANLNGAELLEQFAAEGALKPEQYAALQKVNPGLTKGMIDHGLRMEAAAVSAALDAVTAMAGGQQQYQTIMRWAASSLDAQQRAALNAELGDMTKYRSGFSKLMQLYEQSTGTAGSRQFIHGNGAPPPTPTSPSELAKLAQIASQDPSAMAALRAAASRFDEKKALIGAHFGHQP